MNENLEAAGVPDRIAPDAPLSESCSDSKVYLTILNYLSPSVCSLDPLKDDDPLERATAVVEFLSKLGMRTEFQNYDVVYGEDEVHQQIAASIATVAATLRMQQIMSNGGERKSEKENSERRKTGTLSRKASGEKDRGITLSTTHRKSDKLDKTASQKFLGLFKKEKHETEQPLAAGVVDSYDIKDESPMQKTSAIATTDSPKNEDTVGVFPTVTATEEIADDFPGVGGRIVETSNDVGNIYIEVRDPRKTRNLKLGMLLSFFFGMVFLVLGGMASRVAKQKIESFISFYAPIKSSTGTFDYFSERVKTVKYYIFSYENLGTAVNDGFQLKQLGPFTFEQKIHTYNSSFKTTTSSNKPSLIYMERNEFTPQNLEILKETYVTVPSYNYISLMSSSFVGPLVNMIPSSISAIKAYYNSTITSSMAKYLIPLYLKYTERLSSNVDSTIATWAANGTAILTNGKKFIRLSKSIPLNAAMYLFNADNTYALRRYTLKSSEGVPAWLNPSKSYDAVITSALQSVGLSQVDALSVLTIVRSWINQIIDYPEFLDGLKDELNVDHRFASSQTSSISSLSDLGIYQFSTGNLVSSLSSGSSYSIMDFPELFPSPPFSYALEIDSYMRSYSKDNSDLTTGKIKSFLNVFTNSKYAWSFMSSFITSYNSSHPYAAIYSNCGITSSNYQVFTSYLKHLAKMFYLKSSGLGFDRELPPVSTLYPGMFIRLSAYDLLMGYEDPNLKAGLAADKMPFIKSYPDDSSHWVEHFNDYNQISTGKDNVSDVYRALQLMGKTSIRGIWSSPESVSSFVGDTGISPFYKESPLSSFSKWSDVLQRSVDFSFSSKHEFGSFDVSRYLIDENTLKNEDSFLPNTKYFMDGPNGVANMAPANLGAEIWISNPHFLGGDSTLRSPFTFDSFSPKADLHQSFVDVESWSGSVMQGADRHQINFRLRRSDWFSEPGYSDLFYNYDTIYAPLLWVDSSYEIDPRRYEDIYHNVYKWENGAMIFQVVFLIIGILLFLVGFYLTYQFTKKGEKTVSRVQSIFKKR
jgi:hypothetical protein